MSPPDRARLAEMWAPVEPFIHRARGLAQEQRHAHVSVPHLAAVLLQENEVESLAEACGADAELALYAALGTVDELPRRRWWQLGAPVEDRTLVQLCNGALSHAYAAELDAVSAELLLVQVLSFDPASTLAERLDALGLELLPLRRLIAHGTTEEPPLRDGAGPCRIRVLNDPFTPFDVVIDIFESCFGFAADRAERLMWRVHRGGEASFSVDDWNRARREVESARARSQSGGYPLRMVLEAR